MNPSINPTNAPTLSPSVSPSDAPSLSPTSFPTEIPSGGPTESPTSCDEACDAYSITIRSIYEDPFDSTVTVYEYSIVRTSAEGICTGSLVSFLLGICTDNVNSLDTIFESIEFYSPLVIGDSDVILSRIQREEGNPLGIGIKV